MDDVREKVEKREMEHISQRVKRSNIEAGDHIYTWRIGFTYAHHGIYIGEGRVIHFTQHGDSSSSSSSYLSSSYLHTTCKHYNCGFKKENSGVISSCLDCFLRYGSLYRVRYAVSRLSLVSKLRAGTCTIAKSDPAKDVIHRATYLLYEGFGDYSLLTNNCEYFALYCKTGLLLSRNRPLEGSGQASVVMPVAGTVMAVFSTVAAVSSPVVTPALIPFVAMPAAWVAVAHYWSRYEKDISVRSDAVKVKVEDVAAFQANRTA